MDAIFKRRSIRRFAEREITPEDLEQLLEAVRWSPSWANSQCWELILIKAPETKAALQQLLTETNPARQALVQAPLVIAFCARLGQAGFSRQKEARTKFGDWFMYDLGIATQNLSLAAHDLGLGSVVIGAFDHDRAKELLRIPDGYELVSLLPIGYPAQTPAAPRRKEWREFVHQETFEGPKDY